MKRLLVGTAALGAAGWAGWLALVRAQGDSEIAFEPPELEGLTVDERGAHGTVTLVNRGKVGGVVRRVDSRLLTSDVPGRVLVTRQGSRPPARGWWESNCLNPGQSCVAEVDVEVPPDRLPVVIELDAHEIGRRLVVHRKLRLTVG